MLEMAGDVVQRAFFFFNSGRFASLSKHLIADSTNMLSCWPLYALLLCQNSLLHRLFDDPDIFNTHIMKSSTLTIYRNGSWLAHLFLAIHFIVLFVRKYE